MASAPSASALSAVLRCRRNIWTRNPPTKRPSASVYSLGLAGETLRDCPEERSASSQAVPRGESAVVVVGGRLAASYRSDSQGDEVSREKREFRPPKLWQPPGDARPAAGRLPERDAGSKITPTIKYQTLSARVRKPAFAKDARERPAGVLKLSVTSCPCFMEKAGQIPSFVSAGWSALRSTCLSLTLSTVLCLNLGGPCCAKQRRSAPRAMRCRRANSPPPTTSPGRKG